MVTRNTYSLLSRLGGICHPGKSALFLSGRQISSKIVHAEVVNNYCKYAYVICKPKPNNNNNKNNNNNNNKNNNNNNNNNNKNNNNNNNINNNDKK